MMGGISCYIGVFMSSYLTQKPLQPLHLLHLQLLRDMRVNVKRKTNTCVSEDLRERFHTHYKRETDRAYIVSDIYLRRRRCLYEVREFLLFYQADI